MYWATSWLKPVVEWFTDLFVLFVLVAVYYAITFCFWIRILMVVPEHLHNGPCAVLFFGAALWGAIAFLCIYSISVCLILNVVTCKIKWPGLRIGLTALPAAILFPCCALPDSGLTQIVVFALGVWSMILFYYAVGASSHYLPT